MTINMTDAKYMIPIAMDYLLKTKKERKSRINYFRDEICT